MQGRPLRFAAFLLAGLALVNGCAFHGKKSANQEAAITRAQTPPPASLIWHQASSAPHQIELASAVRNPAPIQSALVDDEQLIACWDEFQDPRLRWVMELALEGANAGTLERRIATAGLSTEDLPSGAMVGKNGCCSSSWQEPSRTRVTGFTKARCFKNDL